MVGKTYGDVLSGFNTKDNTSLTLNIYTLFLYDTVGWSETLIRLPALIAGIACIVLLPFFLRNFTGRGGAVVFAFLLGRRRRLAS